MEGVMSDEVVVPVENDGLYQCAECGYSRLIKMDSRCPQCKCKLDWSSVGKLSPEERMSMIKKRQMNVLITAIVAFIISLLIVPVISIYSDGTISHLSYTTISSAFEWSMFSKTMIQIPVMGAEWIAIGLLTGISYLLVSKMD